MDREHLKTTDEEVASEFGRVLDLLGQARSRPSDRSDFPSRVDEARANRLNWVEALEYAAERTKDRF